MKGTKELLILALPLMAVGCSGGGTATSPPPPPPSVDPEGVFLSSTPIGNGDTLFGIVTADGTADFLEFNGALSAVTPTTPFVILAPKNIVPDENGNYSVSYDGFSGNGKVLPSGDINETGTFSGLAQAASSLSGNYTVTGAIPEGASVNPQSTSTVNYNVAYQKSAYETPASASIIAGQYNVALIVGTTSLTGGNFTITAGSSATQATLTGIDGATSCNYTGTVTVPDTAYNAYKISIQTTGGGCQLLFDNLEGLGTYLSVNNVPTVLAILTDKGTSQGVLLVMTPAT